MKDSAYMKVLHVSFFLVFLGALLTVVSDIVGVETSIVHGLAIWAFVVPLSLGCLWFVFGALLQGLGILK